MQNFRIKEPYILLLDVTAMDKQQQPSYTSEEEEEKNEALALRYHNDIFSKGKLEVADEILSSDFVLHNPVLPIDSTYHRLLLIFSSL